ncbi:MAG TPA: alpha-amylase family glycosyl hydrolase [Anaerolineaceae bacterium]
MVTLPLSSETNENAALSLARLLPRLETRFNEQTQVHPERWAAFLQRLQAHFPTLFKLLHHLYGDQYDFFYHLEELLVIMAQSWLARSEALRRLDDQRESEPGWYLSNQMVGGVCYVDLFAGTLEGIRQRIPYFKELGLTYLHLMPLFLSPEGKNDGGYAISSYRQVNPALGTVEELASLAEALREEGISLVLDFVFNHTADEHEWAQRAKAGDRRYQNYYRMYPNRQMPDAYERTLREIFPDEHPGAFTFFPEMDKWVWTTFHSNQWDLNYDNPEVFNCMAGELLALANLGIEILRLDAVAFTWKKMGTSCENLDEAHLLIQAFNAVTRIAAPALLFKSEAIVHPDDVVKYIALTECQISYNPLLMALLWEALATREVNMLRLALRERFRLPEGCAWVNYVRCHDDIGWTFSDEDAARLGIQGFDHRRFLNAFYTGRFEGSFGRGLPFQENPKTGDCRISGTCASLAGLEKALVEETAAEVELAVRRIALIHGIILTVGGIPLIYLGDEIGTLNDHTFRSDPAKASDSRWVHRPYADWDRIALRNNPQTLEGTIYARIKQFIQLRKAHPAFTGLEMQVMDIDNPNILGFVRAHSGERVIVLANFSEREQHIPANLLRLYGLSYDFMDLLTQKPLPFRDVFLEPYQFLCLQC